MMQNDSNRRTHLLDPRRSAVSTTSATMIRKASSCMPEEERELIADTIQSGHLEGEPGTMRSASDVIYK
jgi:hypothetical protein